MMIMSGLTPLRSLFSDGDFEVNFASCMVQASSLIKESPPEKLLMDLKFGRDANGRR